MISGRISLVEADEAFLVGTDLVHAHVVVSGLGEFADSHEVLSRIRAAGDLLGDGILRHSSATSWKCLGNASSHESELPIATVGQI